MACRVFVLNVLVYLCVLIGCCCGDQTAGSPESKTVSIHPSISVVSGPQIFPESWLQPPFNIKAKPIDPENARRASELITREIARYPAELIERTLGHVYLLGDLCVFDSIQYGGTASSQDVYIVAKSPAAGYSDDWLAGTFHHEYSTVLLNRYLKHFDQVAWNAVNPPGFKYLGGSSWDRKQGKEGGAAAIEQNKSHPTATSDQLKYGFLAEYSTSSIENDFNEYAAALFADTTRLWKLAKQYPGVLKKVRLTIKFYQALDPTLNEQYFRSLEKH